MSHQAFFASLQPPLPAKPFAQTLPVVAIQPATSPWSPKPATPVEDEPPTPSNGLGDGAIDVDVDLEAGRAEAVARAREEGLRETDALRAQLAQAIAALTAATENASILATSQIAEAATTIVEAWLGRAPSFQPIIAGWLARCTEASTVRVNPADLDTLRAAIGEAPLSVVADATIAAGDLHVRSSNLELRHCWAERLGELRTAIHALIDQPVDRAEVS